MPTRKTSRALRLVEEFAEGVSFSGGSNAVALAHVLEHIAIVFGDEWQTGKDAVDLLTALASELATPSVLERLVKRDPGGLAMLLRNNGLLAKGESVSGLLL